MSSKKDEGKALSLRQHGALNPHPEKVADAEFLASDFFDARDLVQVKYEMVRRVQNGQPVSQVSRAFGLSRTAYYEARTAFEHGGLPGLLPQRPGPRGAHKLTEGVVEVVLQAIAASSNVTSAELSVVIGERFGLSVHPRSIERALERRKKKQPKPKSKES